MSDSISSSSIQPPRFGGKSSFSSWKLKVLAYLQPLGLREAVVGPPLERKDEKGDEPRLGKSTQQQEKAYAILLNLLDDELIDLVASVEPGNAAGVWKVLVDTYDAKTTASLCHTLDMFMNIKFKENESFDMYKARFINLVLKLKEMGETLSPSIQRYIILKGLPASYDPLVQSLKVNDRLTLDEVCTHIKDNYETNKRYPKELSLVDLSEPTGFASLAYDGKKKTVKGVCYRCGNRGHFAKECALNNSDSRDGAEQVDYGHFFA